MRDYKITITGLTIQGTVVDSQNYETFYGESKTNYPISKKEATQKFEIYLSSLNKPIEVEWTEHKRNTYAQKSEWKAEGKFKKELI